MCFGGMGRMRAVRLEDGRRFSRTRGWEAVLQCEETRGSANSTFLCGYDIGYGLGGGIAGSLITGLGYSAMWSIVSLACVLSVIVYVAWARHSDTSLSKVLAKR